MKTRADIEFRVPSEYLFVSNIPNFSLPSGHVIVNKGITGCGMTEFVLRSGENVILCSPRRSLLECKSTQFRDDLSVKYMDCSDLIPDYCEDHSYQSPDSATSISFNPTYGNSILFDSYSEAKRSINGSGDGKSYTIKGGIVLEVLNHLSECENSNIPCKILVTYDSLRHVLYALRKDGVDRVKDFRIVVDEFHSILADSTFKSGVEMSLIQDLSTCLTVTYISATPIDGVYLNEIRKVTPSTSRMTMVWEDSKLRRSIEIRQFNSNDPISEVIKIVNRYLSGQYDFIVKDGDLYFSDEVVFYINSVRSIIRVLKSCKGLDPSQVNILCSKTSKNIKELGKAGYSIGDLPIKGGINKKFTFCTKMVYMGVDFYSTCASTYIVSNPNKITLSLDVELDLPQILGRQRLISNPFRDIVTIISKDLSSYYRQTLSDFNSQSYLKGIFTNSVLRTVTSLCESELTSFIPPIGQNNPKLSPIKDSLKDPNLHKIFLSRLLMRIPSIVDLTYLSLRSDGMLIFNILKYLSEYRGWEILQRDLRSHILSLSMNSLSVDYNLTSLDLLTNTGDKNTVGKWVDFITSSKSNRDKFRSYCEFMELGTVSSIIKGEVTRQLDLKYGCFGAIYEAFGYDVCKLREFDLNSLRSVGRNRPSIGSGGDYNLVYDFMCSLSKGDFISASKLKEDINSLYSKYNIQGSTSAKKVLDSFNVQYEEKLVRDKHSNKVIRGFVLK